ncbi:DUF4132 domain-containing protein [Streptomyces sp. NPDC006553]|uniref:DUF4132 domain-containing protein n=1 Tax=Streptomyces sp. NPDC006553 TaxID=3157180 RepID=UPI0033A74888
MTLDPWARPEPVVRCRTVAGRALKKVPAALGTEPVVRELTALAEWIGDHSAGVLTSVEQWMTQSLPVPAALIREVWPDPYWRRALRYAVVAPCGGGEADVERAGALTGVVSRPGGALLVSGVDGEERELDDAVVVIPHPVLLDPLGIGLLERWRKVLVSLGGEQGVEQLDRAVYVRPDCSPAPGTRGPREGISAFHGAVYASGAHVERGVRSFGGRVGGERAGYSFGHGGRMYGMVADLRHQGPAAPVSLYDFRFAEARGRHGAGAYDAVPRPVWSEGIRAMAVLYDEREAASGGSSERTAAGPDSGSAYQAFLVACAEYATAGAPEAGSPEPRPPAGARQLLDAGAVLAGPPGGQDEEWLTARRYRSPLVEGDECFVRLVVARAVEAQDAVARALGLEPDAGEATPVGRAPIRPLDLLTRVCRAHPGLAREAMGLLAPLRTCANTAGTRPGRAATQLRATLKKLTATQPELLPYALDEGARIVAAEGSVAMARPLYVEARTAEQRLGGIDEDTLRELVSEFRELGVVDEKLLRQYRTDLAARSSESDAYESYRRLVLEWCRAESAIPTSVVRDGVTHHRQRDVPSSFAVELAQRVGGPPADDTQTEIFHLLLRNGGFERATASVWEAWAAPLQRDLAEHADTADRLRTHFPDPGGSSAAAKTAAAEAWLALMARVGLLELFTGTTEPVSVGSAERANAWLTQFFAGYAGLRQPVDGLEPVVASIAALIRAAGGTREPLVGLKTRSLGGDFWGVGFDLGLLALMQRVGMPLGEPAGEQGVCALQWIQRRGTAGVESVLAYPGFREPIRGELTGAVRGSLGYTVTRHSLTPFPKVTRQVAASEPLRELMAGILDERARCVRAGGAGGLFALQDLLLHVEPFVVAGAVKHFDGYVREALAGDPAVLLAETLRAGCRAHEHEGDDRATACGLRQATVDHARELLEATDETVRDRHTEMYDGEPATRRSRYLDFRPGSAFAQDLLPVVEKALPRIAGDACRSRALGVLQGVLWCERWQATLRGFMT